MHCHYCDELEKMKREAFTVYALEQLLAEVDRFELERGPHHSVSLTGGEPLFYAKFLKNLMPKLKEKGFVTYMETNGTFPDELKEVIRWTDIIAMDMKPSSSTHDRNFFEKHKRFLKTAIRKDVFVKIVITPDTQKNEIEKCVNLVKDVNPKIPFIFQPLSDTVGINLESLKLIENDFFYLAKEHLHDVRVIPQMHKIWGVR
jgi:organic radical activating enzyme